MKNITYQEFIENIINTRGQWSEEVLNSERGCEKHHIVPRSKGGSGDKANGQFSAHSKNSNCIYLYPAEHFIAHYLLAVENPGDKQIYFGLNNMLSQNGSWRDLDFNVEYNALIYEDARKKCSKFLSEFNKINNLGSNNSFYGKHHTEKTKQKIREKNLGRNWTDEQRKAQSKRLKGRKVSAEGCLNISNAKIGAKNPMWGKKGSLCSSYGKIASEETKNKMSANNYRARKLCCIETNTYYNSIKKASEATNISAYKIKLAAIKHMADINGNHWEFLNG